MGGFFLNATGGLFVVNCLAVARGRLIWSYHGEASSAAWDLHFGVYVGEAARNRQRFAYAKPALVMEREGDGCCQSLAPSLRTRTVEMACPLAAGYAAE